VSYSFSVRAKTKGDAKAQIVARLAEVVERHPNHAEDRDQAQATAFAFIDALDDDDTREVSVAVSGTIRLTSTVVTSVTGASVSVGAYLVPRSGE